MIAAAISTDQLAELLAQHLAQHQIGPWSATLQHMVLWSPGLLILIGIYYVIRQLIKFFEPFITAFIETQRDQAKATVDMSVAVKSLADKDGYQQREILGVLQVVAEDVRDLKQKLGG